MNCRETSAQGALFNKPFPLGNANFNEAKHLKGQTVTSQHDNKHTQASHERTVISETRRVKQIKRGSERVQQTKKVAEEQK